jgi:predicted TIM-barrel fold metal-dependent hydrolase
VQNLFPVHGTFDELVAAFDAEVGGARRAGYVALKSIAAYRTGLAVEPVSTRAAEAAFQEVRADGTWRRLASKPLVDFFVRRGLRRAASQGLPVQFHTGYGDPDLDLRLANPLHLRPLFEDYALTAVPIVLLHESYPFTAEAAFLAAAYPNAYLDLAFSLPPLDFLELRRVVAVALGAAPAGKLMVSSDGVAIPEHYWLGAVRARRVLSDVLGAMVEAGELAAAEAEDLGRMVLGDNARQLYGLGAQ